MLAYTVTLDNLAQEICLNSKCVFWRDYIIGNCSVRFQKDCDKFISAENAFIVDNSKTKPVVKYPNVFIKYKKLPDVVKGILKDRGKDYTYMFIICEDFCTQIFCKTPEGILLSGISFFKDGDKFDYKKGLQIAAGRLEATLKWYENNCKV